MRIVAAPGGDALLERSETPNSEIQQHHIQRAVINDLVSNGVTLVCAGGGGFP